VAGSCEYGNKLSASIKGVENVDQLRYRYILKNGSAPGRVNY
jgi:hypothetical protein